MTPDPHPTLDERAAALEVSAKIAQANGDVVFAQYLSREAHLLRMEAIDKSRKAGG